MAFDQSTRNRLQRFVTDARELLTKEFTRQLQHEYGLDPSSGSVTPIDELNIDDSRFETARILRETLHHYLSSSPSSDKKELLERIVREEAFTVLNRLAALRMAEAREILIESLAKGHNSRGFQLYKKLAGTALGETGDSYRSYLFSIFDEFALDLKVLFDRFSPSGRLFPRESALLEVLALINGEDVAPLWAEDETIGWIYQYFNSKEERKQMRGDSSAPRNSRELAVRNQFFTPRYVVEFLTDNTLGRIWYEMTEGQTALKERCRYLVRRPDEVFLGLVTDPNQEIPSEEHVAMGQLLLQGDESRLPEFDESESSQSALRVLALCSDGYVRHPLVDGPDGQDWLEVIEGRVIRSRAFEDQSTQDLMDALFRLQRREHMGGDFYSEFADTGVIATGNEVRRRVLQSWTADLSQEDLLKQPVFIPYRPLKDPRTILMLDPACGSMHFGLYAFDLFEVMYEEWWDRFATNEQKAEVIADCQKAQYIPVHEIAQSDDQREFFVRQVPRLIIENNINGIDIDPRAVQIAGLSLWLRAQRAWLDQQVIPMDRPQVRRSNIVCAEPMPGDRELLEEFIATLSQDVPSDLVRTVFERMELAGEAGALLKIEEDIRGPIAKAKNEWLQHKLTQKELDSRPQGALADFLQPTFEQSHLNFDYASITDELFFDDIEEKVVTALRHYAEGAADGGGYQRRLFADDAEHGFAFINLLRKKFDIVLMNPPFGEFSDKTKSFAEAQYKTTKNDIYGAFVERTVQMLISDGRIGAITPRTWLALTRFEGLRKSLLDDISLEYLIDLGYGVLESMAEVAVFVLSKTKVFETTAFLGAFGAQNKSAKVEQFVQELTSGHINDVLLTTLHHFREIPQKIFAFGLPPLVLDAISQGETVEASGIFAVKQGIATGDNDRFLRLLVEAPVHSASREWIPYAKGGDFGMFQTALDLVVKWHGSGREIKTRAATEYGSASRTVKNEETYFCSGLTFSLVSQAGFSVRAFPSGCIYDMGGPCIFRTDANSTWSIEALLSVTNSSFIQYCLNFLTDSRHWHVITIQSLPIWKISESERDLLAELSRGCAGRLAALSAKDETDGRFDHPFIDSVSLSLKEHVASLGSAANSVRRRVSESLQKTDDLISSHFSSDASQFSELREKRLQQMFESWPKSDEERSHLLSENLVSWVIGCVLGRWDPRVAILGKPDSELIDPFAPLPVCPPGMLQNEEGLPAGPEDVPESYPLPISWPGVLVDDSSHPEDIEGRTRKALQVIWSARADAIEEEACEALGVRTLREYFSKPNNFFANHLSRYSKSHRQAPIYWPLATASGSYTLWLYYHRLDAQTLYRCVVDFVAPKLRQTNEAVGQLRAKAGRTPKDEGELERQQDFAIELQAFRDELLRLAQLPWRPDPTDGVQITAAPLWRLFRLPKWQKTLKDTWQKLEKEEYDWAHMAMTIWPQRVVPKCVKDRSLAIAHDLEDLFWVEDTTGWRQLQKTSQEIEEQKQRQRSEARTHLKSLLAKICEGKDNQLPSEEVRRHLAQGDWDDREVALLLYPYRVAEKCWDDPVLAKKFNLKLPTKRTKASLQQFIKKVVAASCPDLAPQLDVALSGRKEPFVVLWSEVDGGDNDRLAIALSLWPDRVIDKCLSDLDMAEHHGVQKYFWCQHPLPEWRRREEPEVEVANEVARRRGSGQQVYETSGSDRSGADLAFIKT